MQARSPLAEKLAFGGEMRLVFETLEIRSLVRSSRIGKRVIGILLAIEASAVFNLVLFLCSANATKQDGRISPKKKKKKQKRKIKLGILKINQTNRQIQTFHLSMSRYRVIFLASRQKGLHP